MQKIRHTFITGLGALLPIFITIYVVVRTFTYIDSWLQGYIKLFFDKEIPGLGFLAVLLVVMFIGLITNTYFAHRFSAFVNKIFTKIPLVKTIYAPLKGVVSLSKMNETDFKKVVMIEFPNEGIQSIGFVTQQDLSIFDEKLVSVFIPTTPNPTNGFLVYVKPEKVKVLDVSIEEGLKAVISLGSLTPTSIHIKSK